MYQKVYFRIETGYVWGVGHTEEQKIDFENKLNKVFQGWDLLQTKYNNECQTFKLNKSYLYCHPMDLSGVIDTDLIPVIEQRLRENHIELRKIDLYETYEDLTDEEYLNKFKNQKEQIEKDILNLYKVKRRNQFFPSAKIMTLFDKYHINCINHNDDNWINSIEYNYMYELLNDLVKQKKLVKINDGNYIYYRTLLKCEL